MKFTKSIITVSLLVSILFACCDKDETIKSESLNYKTIKIGDFTAGEIGSLHNKALESLEDNGKMKSSKKEIIATLQQAKIDNRISKTEISATVNNLNEISLFKKATTSKLPKEQSIIKMHEEILNFLISKNEISQEAKKEIDNLSLLNIDLMKKKTDELLDSKSYTTKEKQYFAVYTSIYENSKVFWSKNNQKTGKMAMNPYAADAIGGVLGLYGGPAWSIIQGALVSAAFG